MAKATDIKVNVKIGFLTRLLVGLISVAVLPIKKHKRRFIKEYTEWLEDNSYLKEVVTNQNGLIDEYMGEN